MRRKILFICFALCAWASSYAQGLYSQSLAVTRLTGVWSNGYVTLESPYAIATNKDPEYVASHLFIYKNIQAIQTYKFEYKDKTYYIWGIDFYLDDHSKDGVIVTHFLILSGSQNEKLKNVSSKAVSFLGIPCAFCSYITFVMNRDTAVEAIKKAILEKDDELSYKYCITAKKVGDDIHFNYGIDIGFNEPLDLYDNADGGYFRISSEQWGHLFYR